MWRFLNYNRYNAFENMAIDEAIFRETIKDKKKPTIRFYGWRPAAVSIGYFQDPQNELNLEQCGNMGVDIVRRLTGGKAVFHNDEITYSVVAGAQEKSFPANILGTYKVISDCLVQGLANLGIKADLAPAGRATQDLDLRSCCFSVPSRNELLVAGRKICGSAQMRTKGGFLQHGSLLLTFDPVKALSVILPSSAPEHLAKLSKTVAAINEGVANPIEAKEICNSLRKGFADVLGVQIVEEPLTPGEILLKNDLMKKYEDLNWNVKQEKYFKKVNYCNDY
jgi:lipoate-protein ligase A